MTNDVEDQRTVDRMDAMWRSISRTTIPLSTAGELLRGLAEAGYFNERESR